MSFSFFKRKTGDEWGASSGRGHRDRGRLHPVRKVLATTAAVAPVVEVTQAEQENLPVYGE